MSRGCLHPFSLAVLLPLLAAAQDEEQMLPTTVFEGGHRASSTRQAVLLPVGPQSDVGSDPDDEEDVEADCVFDFNASESISEESTYQVFVMRVTIGHYKDVIPLYHTETIFCEVPKEKINTTLENSGCSPGGFNCSLLPHLHFPTEWFDATDVKRYKQVMVNQRCFASGFPSKAGIRCPVPFKPDATRPLGPHFYARDVVDLNTMKLIYMGAKKDLRLGDFLSNMEECGNWDAACYNKMRLNCNDFTAALMTGLDLGIVPYLRPELLARKLIYSNKKKIVPGYSKLGGQNTNNKCGGTKCRGTCSKVSRVREWTNMFLNKVCKKVDRPATPKAAP